jgi:hypothetical protein
MKLLSVVRGLDVFGGLSNALALMMEIPSFGGADVVSAREASCDKLPVMLSIEMSQIVVKRMVNIQSPSP